MIANQSVPGGVLRKRSRSARKIEHAIGGIVEALEERWMLSGSYWVSVDSFTQGIAGNQNTGAGSVVPAVRVDASDPEDALRKALGAASVTLTAEDLVDGPTATYGGGTYSARLSFRTADNTGHAVAGTEPTLAEQFSLDGSAWVLAFEDGGDDDFNDGYFAVHLRQDTAPEDDCCCCGEGNPAADAGSSGGNAPSSSGAGGVRLADGGIRVAGPSLSTSGFGSGFGQTTAITNRSQQLSTSQATGNGVVTEEYARLYQSGTNGAVVVKDAKTSLGFTLTGGSYSGHFFIKDTLTSSGAGTNNAFVWTDTAGGTTSFYGFDGAIASNLQGKFQSYTDAAGNRTYVKSYTGSGEVAETLRVQGTGASARIESYSYSYVSSGANAGKLEMVSYRRGTGDPLSGSYPNNVSWDSVVRKLAYDYYDGTTDSGNLGDLKTVEVQDGSDNVLDTEYFRWYKPGAITGTWSLSGSGSSRTVELPNNYGIEAGDTIQISGASDSRANGYFKVSGTTSTTFTFEIWGQSDSPTGTNVTGASILARGYQSGLKYHFDAESYGRLAQNVSAWSTASDAQIAQYASEYYEYYPDRRVSKATLQASGCSGCGAAGLGTFTYSYSSSTNSDGYNTWSYKSTETLPDGNQNIVYTNYAGQPILKITKNAAGQQWIDYYRYNDSGQVVLHANPSAVGGYSETLADLVGYNSGSGTAVYLHPSTGLIETTEYGTTLTAGTSTAGDVIGYLKATRIKQGTTGTSILQQSTSYFSHSNSAGITIYPVASNTRYRNTDGTGGQTVSHAYTWISGTNQYDSVTTTYPTVATAQNGPNAATTSIGVYDALGRVTWQKDQDGFIAYFEYAQDTSAVTKQIQDVNTALVDNEPGGWTTPSGGGLHLTTQFVTDELGRTTKITDAKLNETYIVYNDAAHETRTYRGFDGTNTTGPIEISREHRGASYIESLTVAVSPTLSSGQPNGEETFTGTNIQSLSRSFYNSGGQLDHADGYFSLLGLNYTTGTNALGTAGINFLRSSFGYEKRGRQAWVKSPDGTIRHTFYDALGRMTSQWQGVDDVPTSDLNGDSATDWRDFRYNVETNGSAPAGTTMAKTESHLYDGYDPNVTSIGDSNLTRVVRYPGGSAENLVDEYYYDWRDRQVATKSGLKLDANGRWDTGAESVSGQRQAVYYELDNLGEVVSTSQYDADQVSLAPLYDTGFSLDGVADSDHGNDGTDAVAQPDGKIIVVGGDGGSFYVARFNSDGTLDTTFDGDGKASTSVGNSYADAEGVALQSDGKIVVVGTVMTDASTIAAKVVRYNSDGSLDTSFGTSGIATPLSGGVDYGHAVAIQDDGKIVVAGESLDYAFILRLTTAGQLDTTFATTGYRIFNWDVWSSCSRFYDVAIQPDGKIVAGGGSFYTGTDDNFILARVTSAGELDTSFDADGTVSTDFQDLDYASSIALQPDGKIVAAGTSYSGTNTSDWALARYNSDGSLDSSFGTNGQLITEFTGYASSVAVLDDGRIAVSGTAAGDAIVARYSSNGTLDSSFDGDGVLSVNLDSVARMANNGDRLVLAGTVGSDMAAAVLNIGEAPVQPAQQYLRARTTSEYDELGRAFKASVYNVDQSTGSTTPGSGQTGHILTSNTWYNGRGMVIKSAAPNGLFSKVKYDGAGRTVATYIGYDTDDTEGGSAYAGAGSVTGDTVIEQTKNIFDPAGNLVVSTSYERLETDTSGTGELGAATNQAFIQVRANWFDKANRQTSSVNYGRDNGGTRYVFNVDGTIDDNNGTSDGDGIPDLVEGNAPNPNTSDDYIVGKYEYDDAGRPFQTTDNLGHKTRTLFDLMGRTTAVIENYTNGAVAETETDTDRTTEYLYDQQGRLAVMRAKNPKGSGNGVENQDTAYFYRSDVDRSLVTETLYPDSAHIKSVSSLTRSGTTATATVTGHGFGVGDTILIAGATQPEYNGSFVITAVTTDTFSFTVLDSAATPATGTIRAYWSAGTDLVKHTYDIQGRTTSTTDQRQVVHNYTYDAVGRLSFDAVTLTAGTAATNVASAVLGIGKSYDTQGRVEKVTSYAGTHTGSTVVNEVQYAFDGWGNVTKIYQAHNGAVNTGTTPSVQYAYEDGLPSGSTNTAALYLRLDTVTNPTTNGANATIYYNYGTTSGNINDMLSRVDNIAADANGTTQYARYTYVGSSRIIKTEHPNTTNNLTLAYSLGAAGQYSGLDRFGRIVQKLWKKGILDGTNYDGYVYTYDRNSNILTKDYYATGATNIWDEQFTYDGLDRVSSFKRGTLVSGTISGGNVKFSQDWTALESLGNWQTFTQDADGAGAGAATTQSRTYNAVNEIGTIGGTGVDWIDPVYDNAGNMISGPKASINNPTGTNQAELTRLHFVYDPWNRLVEVKNDSGGNPGSTLASYEYDGLNQRITKYIAGTSTTDDFYYNGDWQAVEVRRNGATTPFQVYVWDQSYIDTPIFRNEDWNNDGTLDYYIYYTTDANNNITAVYEPSSGTIQERYVYDAYGRVQIYDRLWAARTATACNNTVLFTGAWKDYETGYDYHRNRYHPNSLNWISRDPKGYVDGESLYEYAKSNPTAYTDPFGLRSNPADDGAKVYYDGRKDNPLPASTIGTLYRSVNGYTTRYRTDYTWDKFYETTWGWQDGGSINWSTYKESTETWEKTWSTTANLNLELKLFEKVGLSAGVGGERGGAVGGAKTVGDEIQPSITIPAKKGSVWKVEFYREKVRAGYENFLPRSVPAQNPAWPGLQKSWLEKQGELMVEGYTGRVTYVIYCKRRAK